MSKRKVCSETGCNETRSRWSPRNMCEKHDTEADQLEHAVYVNDPQRQVEASLDECETVEDLKQFILVHLMPD